MDFRHEAEHNPADFSIHLERNKYGNFVLTDAIRPSPNLEVVPRQGYTQSVWREEHFQIPVIGVSASAEVLFPLWRDLLDLMPKEIDVVLESSHEMKSDNHTSYWRCRIEKSIFESIVLDYEDLLLNDGCTGVTVLSARKSVEIQFEEHKLLLLHGFTKNDRLFPIFREHNVPYISNLRFITEVQHFHSTDDNHMQRFDQLKYELGAEKKR